MFLLSFWLPSFAMYHFSANLKVQLPPVLLRTLAPFHSTQHAPEIFIIFFQTWKGKFLGPKFASIFLLLSFQISSTPPLLSTNSITNSAFIEFQEMPASFSSPCVVSSSYIGPTHLDPYTSAGLLPFTSAKLSYL